MSERYVIVEEVPEVPISERWFIRCMDETINGSQFSTERGARKILHNMGITDAQITVDRYEP